MKKYKFNAKIQPGGGGGAFVLFPYAVEKEFGSKGKIAVNVTFDGVPDRGALIKYGFPEHVLGVPKAIRTQIGKVPGDTIAIELWKDEEERRLEVPEDLATLLKKEGLFRSFEEMSYTHRKEYCRWITEAKKEETRQRRLEKSVDLLKRGVKTPG
jgi:hypothetical protein